MVYSRKLTISYAATCLGLWVTFVLSSLCAQALYIRYEVSVTILLGIGFTIALTSVVGIVLAFREKIPWELGIVTVFSIPLLYIIWGAPALYKGLPLAVILLTNLPVAVWYLNHDTRERSGQFR